MSAFVNETFVFPYMEDVMGNWSAFEPNWGFLRGLVLGYTDRLAEYRIGHWALSRCIPVFANW